MLPFFPSRRSSGILKSVLSAIDRLRLFLRPPGRGLYTYSTGGGHAAPLLQALYGSAQAADVSRAWEDALARIRLARVILIGIPSDTGAGIMKGANFGPIGLRLAYLKIFGHYPKDVVDLGDVICVPHLLHDEMYSESQIARTHAALYAGVTQPLPVSPLSIAEQAAYAVGELTPSARICWLGGDHSVSWPAILGCLKRSPEGFGVLHLDAHTDLLDQRLGVRYCFATWAFHAAKRLKPKHLVQVGIRASSKDRGYWESHLPIRQFWSSEIIANPEGTLQQISDHFTELGINRVYISNDIDGTDSSDAPATGTPEPSGLKADWTLRLIEKIRENCDLIGGDVVEVAPPLSGRSDYASEPTCQLGARYLKALF